MRLDIRPDRAWLKIGGCCSVDRMYLAPSQGDIESWNLGLITAYRPGFSPGENLARDRELWADLLHFGRLQVRGRYVENYGSRHAKPMDVRAYLVIGRSDDSGNLKGALRKYGRKYEQDAVKA